MRITFAEPGGANRLEAHVVIEAADPALAARLHAVIAALRLPRAPRYETLLVRADVPELTGKIAILPVRRASTLAARVAAVRAAGPLGIQLVLDDRGRDVERATRLRAAVFAVMEAARGARGCPLFLSRTRRASLALRLAIAANQARPANQPGEGTR